MQIQFKRHASPPSALSYYVGRTSFRNSMLTQYTDGSACHSINSAEPTTIDIAVPFCDAPERYDLYMHLGTAF